MTEKYDPLKSANLITTEQNYNVIDGILNNSPAPVLPPEGKPLDKVREIPPKRRSREREEQELIYARMVEAGIQNMGAYMRKMALNGYVLHVNVADVRELVSLQRTLCKQPQPSGDPYQYLRHLSLGDRCAAKGLCRHVGAAVRSN